MAFDFPNSPTTGQTYSISGGPTYVYNGTAWVVLTPGNQFNRTVFTATAGQTTFSMNYVVGAVDVYRNGVKLAPADFTATNGTSIVLLNAATVGDTIEVISYPQIVYADAVKRTGDTMTGGLNVIGNIGVGTASPAQQVHVYTTGSEAVLRLEAGQTGAKSWDIISASGSTGVGQGSLSIYDRTTNTERMRIDAGGRILTPNQPFATVFNSGTSYLTPSYVTVPYNNVITNNGGHFNTSNYRFTCPVAGYYRVTAFDMSYYQTSGIISLTVAKNGSAAASNVGYGRMDGVNGHSHATYTTILYCSAGDYLTVLLYGGSNGGGYNGATFELVG